MLYMYGVFEPYAISGDQLYLFHPKKEITVSLSYYSPPAHISPYIIIIAIKSVMLFFLQSIESHQILPVRSSYLIPEYY